MEIIRWSVGTAEAKGSLVGAVLVLRVTGVLTLTAMRLLRERIRGLAGAAAALLDLRSVFVPLSEDSLRAFAAEGPARQPVAILAAAEQAELFSVYCWEICPAQGKLRVLFIDAEERALAWVFRRAQGCRPLEPLVTRAPALATR